MMHFYSGSPMHILSGVDTLRSGGTAKLLRGCNTMLYLRTASGDFINAATIAQLAPQRDGAADEITGWIATRADGTTVALADYYTAPGRIETALDYMPAVNAGAVGAAALPCSSENCPCA